MAMDVVIALAAFAFVSSITPGPNNLMLLASGTNFGLRRTVPHMLGISIGFGVMVLGVGAGLMQLFEAVPASYTVLQVLSACYLTYLAWKIANAKPISENQEEAGAEGKPLTFLQAAAFQWVNPKALGMAITAITAYAPQESGFLGIALVAVIFSIVNLPSITTWAVLGTQMKRFLTNPRRLRIFNVSAGLTLLACLYPIVMS
ncbi:MAG: LysE family translocator [Pseudomonadota bacterium]